MNVFEAISSRRTVRKFKDNPVSHEDILKLIDGARLAPYGANLQPLKFSIVTDKETRKELYPYIKYAGYIKEWDPTFEETPTAFIVVFNDTTIKPTEKSDCDSGAAIMTMCHAAKELGLDSCWLGAIDRAAIKEILKAPDSLDITYLLGIGYGDQTGDTFDLTDSVKYEFDDSGNVHVPKRRMEDILL